MRTLTTIAAFLAGAIGVSAFLIILHQDGYVIVFPKGETHVEVLSLLLAASTLIITALAAIVALAAVVGYTAMKEAAIMAGRDAGDKAARELLAPVTTREEATARLAATRPETDRTEELAEALSERGDDDGSPSRN